MANIVHGYAAERFSADQKKLILDTCCQGANESEAQALIAVAEARGLNPLLGECYFVQRWDSNKGRNVWAVQASIDSLRIRAESTGLYHGQDEPEYEYDPKSGELILARVRVYRSDWPRPSIGVARWSEYVQKTKEGKPTKFWLTSPHNQLAKCAEALAIRKAFPKQLAKLYIKEEAGASGETEAEDVVSDAGDTAGAAAGFKTALLQAQNAETLDAVMAEIKDAIARKHVKMEDAVELRKTATAKRKEFKSPASGGASHTGQAPNGPNPEPVRDDGARADSSASAAQGGRAERRPPTSAEPEPTVGSPAKDAGVGASAASVQTQSSPAGTGDGGAPSGDDKWQPEADKLWKDVEAAKTAEELYELAGRFFELEKVAPKNIVETLRKHRIDRLAKLGAP